MKNIIDYKSLISHEIPLNSMTLNAKNRIFENQREERVNEMESNVSRINA